MATRLTSLPLDRPLWRLGAEILFRLLARRTFGAMFRPSCVHGNDVALGSVGNRGRQFNKRGRSLAAARPRLEVTHRTCDGITETRGGESEAPRRIRHRVQKRDGRSASETDAHPLRPPQRRTSGMRSQAWEPRPRVHFWGAQLPPSMIRQHGSRISQNAERGTDTSEGTALRTNCCVGPGPAARTAARRRQLASARGCALS
jgi:hypothetical protein